MDGMTDAHTDSLAAVIGTLGPTLDGPSVVQVVGALALVIGAIVVVAWLYRRMTGGAAGRIRGGDIQIVSRAQVDKRAAILLVAVDGRRVLVGATANTLSPLSEWEPEPEPEMAIEEARVPASSRFDGVLGRVMTKLRALEEVPS